MSVDVDDPPLPTHLQLEVTSACNLRCVMCLVRYRPPVSKLAGAMRPELFHRLLREVPGLTRLTLQGLGEPLLSPYLMEMIEAAVTRRIAVGFNSNGTLLTGRRAADLVASGVDWLHVSLDGAGLRGDALLGLGVLQRVVGQLAERRVRVEQRPARGLEVAVVQGPLEGQRARPAVAPEQRARQDAVGAATW
ncbi:radical SAM protein [Micromonospora thermarum]|uniref:Radical SAM protein n=1 Tax=Micromonospora thermarum TaxID=2720024 RepID=A0ABX0Z7W1_9ACTN|nr:radical SAM protein [Micromonospora thermarum]NJP33941.1 radical SAM protein [Micromonospora thermarum]